MFTVPDYLCINMGVCAVVRECEKDHRAEPLEDNWWELLSGIAVANVVVCAGNLRDERSKDKAKRMWTEYEQRSISVLSLCLSQTWTNTNASTATNGNPIPQVALKGTNKLLQGQLLSQHPRKSPLHCWTAQATPQAITNTSPLSRWCCLREHWYQCHICMVYIA